ncbi:MAG: SBBP repeat-containing protein [Promethearchaeota archaeon]
MKNKKIIILICVIILNLSFLLSRDINNYKEQPVSKHDKTKAGLSNSSLIVYKWNHTWGGIDHEVARDIALDSSGNIYIAGSTNGTGEGGYDMCLVKFNNLGEFQWIRTLGNIDDDSAEAVVVDSSDNIYIAGYVSQSWRTYMVLSKYDSSGTSLLNVSWGVNDNNEAYALALDSSENIYLAGMTWNMAKDEDFCLVKFNSFGVYQWNRTWGGIYDDYAYAIALDSSENIYLGGEYTAIDDIDQDLCLVKFDSNGVYQWNRTWGGDSFDGAQALTLDLSENIYIGGYTGSFAAGMYDMCIVKFNNDGSYQWNRTWGGNNIDWIFGMASDSSDNIYFAGTTNTSKTGTFDFFLGKSDTSGVQQWNHTWDNNGFDAYLAIALDSSENLYLAGTSNLYGTNADVCLVKYDKIIPEINIITPESITYSEPMEGYYPATYSFDENDVGEDPIDWIVDETGGTCNVIEGIAGHKSVIELNDTSDPNQIRVSNYFTPQVSGALEFWWMTNNATKNSYFRLNQNNTIGVNLRISNGYFGYYDSTLHQVKSMENNIWYHHKIIFNASTDQYDWYIDGILEINDADFDSTIDLPNRLLFESHTTMNDYCTYYDAIGYSWDINYNLGDNLNEGLLLKFTPDDLDWMAYSLNGQPNKTILGDTTFPFPDDGEHTIQVFGNSSIGIIYSSNLVDFSVDTTAPISDISFIPHEGVNKVNKSTTFELTADDGIGSGVATIMYKINNSAWIPYSGHFNLSAYDYGYYLISYYSIDVVGNVEDENALLVELVVIPSKPSEPEIPAYDLFLLIGVISTVSILLTKRFLKRRR